jgi:hypothetical protein
LVELVFKDVPMIQYLKSVSGWQKVLLFTLALLPFNLWLFPARTEYLQGLSGYNTPILDVRIGYTPAQAFELIGALTGPGRTLYALSEVTLDLLYPLVYTGLLAALLSWLAPPAFGSAAWVTWLQKVPRAVLLADYLENIGIVLLVLVYPTQPAPLAWAISGVTIVKFTLGLGCLLAVLLAAGKCLLDRLLAA